MRDEAAELLVRRLYIITPKEVLCQATTSRVPSGNTRCLFYHLTSEREACFNVYSVAGCSMGNDDLPRRDLGEGSRMNQEWQYLH
jgi:hypothetical protein